MCAKGRFGDVFESNTDLVVAGLEVQLREDGCFVQFIQEFINDWYGKFIGNGRLIKSAVVDAKSPAPVLADQENQTRI